MRPAARWILLAVGPVAGIWPWAVQLPAQAQAPGNEVQERLKATKAQLDKNTSRKQEIAGDLSRISAERDRITQQQIETARLIQSYEKAISQIESRVAELDSEQQMRQSELDRSMAQIASRLAAMQRMGRNPPPVIVTRPSDALTMVHTAMLLSWAFPEMKARADDLKGKVADLERVKTQWVQERAKQETEVARLGDAQTRLAALAEAKKLTLAERQKELESVSAAIAESAKNIADLSELISRADKAVADNTALGAYDKEQAQAPAAEPPAATGEAKPVQSGESQPKVAMIPPPKPGPAIQLEPTSPFSGNPGRLKPAIPFQQAHAQLPLPAQGRRILNFGDKTQFGSTSKGIVIETRHSAQVTSPCDGWIVFAGGFRSYGQLLIINAGNGYHILLAGLTRIDVPVGQFVLTGEPVGTMPPKTPKAQDSAPVLYVEFRKEGRPVDPEPWWYQGT